MKKLFFMGAVALFLLGSCNSHSGHAHEGHDHEAHEHDHEHGHEGHEHNHEGHSHGHEEHEGKSHDHNPDAILLAPHKAQAVGVEVEEIRPRAFRRVIATGGRIEAAQGAESVVVATVSGVVSFKQNTTEGAGVNAGTPILTISADRLQDGDPARRARIAYEAAKVEYDRANRLIANRIISQKEYNTVKEAYETARLAYEAIGENRTRKGVAVTAPIGGYIKNCLVKEGDYVSVGQPLLTVTQNNRLYLRADVSERYYKHLGGLASANFKTPYDNRVYRLEDLNGKLLSYGKAAGDGSYYVPVTFSFDNRGDVVPGSYVEVFLMSEEQPDAMVIPEEALTEEQGLYFVYVQQCEESYRKQEVKPGATNGCEVQILGGLHPGDRVVVKGAYHVKLASAANALPAHSHEH